MNENIKITPREKISQILSSKKILFIAIFISVSLGFAIISTFNSSSSLLNTISQISGYLPGDEEQIIQRYADAIQTVMKVFKIVGLLPLIFETICIWMLYALGKGKTNSPRGFKFFRIYFAANAIYNLFLGLALDIVGLIALIKIGSTVGIIILSSVLIISTVFFLKSLFYQYMYMMMVGVQNSYFSNTNKVRVYMFIIIMLWIMGISSILSFGGGFFNWFASVMIGLVYIFVAVMFNDYKHTIGSSTENTNFWKMLFGPKNSVKEEGIQIVTSSQRSSSQKVMPTPAYQKAVEEMPHQSQELDLDLLPLFENGVSNRFVIIGQKEYDNVSSNCPIRLTYANVYKDSISEQKILQLGMASNIEVAVAEIELSVYLRDNANHELGFVKKSYNLKDGDIAQLGLILTIATTNGIIKIDKVKLSDGLFWNKESASYLFYTKERLDYSLKCFLAKHEE